VRAPAKARGPTWITGGASYYDYQYEVGSRVVVPWLRDRFRVEGRTVADFGAHGGGMLDALRTAGAASGVGIEINRAIVEASPFRPSEGFRLEVADLTALDQEVRLYDLILLHDVLEHVPDGTAVLETAARSLAPGGRVFVSFPPYYSMVGGHQHLARGWARAVPWIHYLPERAFLRLARPADNEYMSAGDSLDDMLSVRRTRLTLGRAERAFARVGLVAADEELFLSRPEYTLRYGWPTVRAGLVGRTPVVREAFVNGAFYLLAAG
jgi:SAM-dependent methyltransferase